MGDDEENVSLASQVKRSKEIASGESTSQAMTKKDMSKVKCFACHRCGHYAS